MKLVKPRFYNDFVCIADRCTDNCCIGWEIDIDPAALARFDKVGGEFGERLHKAIRRGEGVCTFAFGEGERCALLREDGLCELILHEGENSLCDICALHPRFFGWYNSLKEAGLGLCCEEVCRLLFADSTPLSFFSEETAELWDETCSEELLSYLLRAREQLFSLLQNREKPLGERLVSGSVFVRELQERLDSDDYALPDISRCTADRVDVAAVMEALHTLWSSTESISREWDEREAMLYSRRHEISTAFADFISDKAEEWRYEHIAVYFCYRYFLDGVFEGEVVSRFGFAAMSVLAAALFDCMDYLDGRLTEWQRILNLKLYSKQMEYSAENLELAYDAVWDVPQLSPEYISSCI